MKREPNYKKELKKLTDRVNEYLVHMDKLMTVKGMDSVKRGQQIAHLSNALDMANGSVRRFILDIKDFP